MRCTWEAVKDVKAKNTIERLKVDGADAQELVLAYEEEAEQNSNNIIRLKGEIARLESNVRGLQAKSPVQGGVIVAVGDEDDYFKDEIAAVILDAVQDYIGRVPEGSRRQHILQSIVENNDIERCAGILSKDVKEALRGYREMNVKVRAVLERCGFEVSADGKHWKITYQGDGRYTYVLPKSGSDNRGGLNAGSDICRIVF